MVKTASEILRIAFGGRKNIITPYRVKIGKIRHDMAFEIAEGTDMNHKPMYGVTVVKYSSTKRDAFPIGRLGKLFRTKQEAINYVNRLKNRLGKKKSKRKSIARRTKRKSKRKTLTRWQRLVKKYHGDMKKARKHYKKR